MFTNALTYFLAFMGVWIGAGLAVRSVENLAKILGVSSFAISFLILGSLTSVPEFSVGINSILSDDPEIYVGNLIGASIVIFMLLIPLLTIAGNKIWINREFQGFNLPASLIVIALPAILVMDGKVDRIDCLISVILFIFLAISIQIKRGLFHKGRSFGQRVRLRSAKEILKIIFGVATIFVASKFIVSQTIYFSELFHLPKFLLSLLLISVGTNVPEFSIVLRSLFMKSNKVAFGGYLGSAAINTFLFGFLTTLYGNVIFLKNSYLISIIFAIAGLIMFYYFSRTKNSISKGEGLFLLVFYVLFLITEIMIQRFS